MTESVDPVTPQELKQGFGFTLVLGILTIVLGAIAIARPLFAGIATNAYLGWVFIFGGTTQLIYAVQTRSEGRFLWKLLIGILYLAAGAILLVYPLEGLVTLTLVVGVGILGSGLTQIISSFLVRPTEGWLWLLLRGSLATLVGIWVLVDWPANTPWLIGLLVGITLISDGLGIAILSAAARDVIDES